MKMIDLLLNSIMPITVLLLIVWLFRLTCARFVGVSISYYSWCVVPLGLLAYHLPIQSIAVLSQTAMSVDVTQIVANNVYDNTFAMPAILFCLWGLGAAMLFIYAATSHISYCRQLLLVKSKEFNDLPISTYVSDAVYSPCLVGLIKPKLVLPSEFKSIYNKEQQQLIVAHELCHYQRKDMWWNVVACVLVVCFWFHPLVWWSYRYFRQDQEYSCDFAVLAHAQQSSRINYSKALVITAECTPPSTFALLSFNDYGERNMMKSRIKLIRYAKKTSLRAAVATGVTILTLITGASFAGNSMPSDVRATSNKSYEAQLTPVIRIEPHYPLEAAKNQIEGSVLIKFDVTGEGNTSNISVIKSEPVQTFDSEAIKALKQWKYNATGHTHLAQLVQLDFLLSASSERPKRFLERIEVKK